MFGNDSQEGDLPASHTVVSESVLCYAYLTQQPANLPEKRRSFASSLTCQTFAVSLLQFVVFGNLKAQAECLQKLFVF